jgi:hypothetical protein
MLIGLLDLVNAHHHWFAEASWWEVVGVWIEAGALIAIFRLDWLERREAREERRLQREAREEERKESEERRKAREEERQERNDLRKERKRLEGDRQRDNVTCLGVRQFANTVNEERLCSDLWKQSTNRQPGFAIEKHLYSQLPSYLLRKTEAHSTEITRATVGGTRYWLIFKFPYREHGAVLDDLRIMNLGETLVAWDGEGKPISIA